MRGAAPVHRHVQRLKGLDGLDTERHAEREHDRDRGSDQAVQHAVGLYKALDRPLEHKDVAGLGADRPQLRHVVLDNPLRPVGVGPLGQVDVGVHEDVRELVRLQRERLLHPAHARGNDDLPARARLCLRAVVDHLPHLHRHGRDVVQDRELVAGRLPGHGRCRCARHRPRCGLYNGPRICVTGRRAA
jgi:hypothetical protein